MNSCHLQEVARTCCAFCGKSFPIVAGQRRFWRSPNGLFFCNEVCADDAEEVTFQNLRRSNRKGYENPHAWAGASRVDE
jgi:hypothetical protein